VQRNRQRFSQGRVAQREGIGEPQKLPRIDTNIFRKGALEFLGPELPAVGAETRTVRVAVATFAATGRLAPDDTITEGKALDRIAYRGDLSRILVATDRPRTPPPLHDEVEVGSANAAVTHTEQGIVRPQRGERPFFDFDPALLTVDGRTHGVGQRHGKPPSSLAPTSGGE